MQQNQGQRRLEKGGLYCCQSCFGVTGHQKKIQWWNSQKMKKMTGIEYVLVKSSADKQG